MKKLQIIYLKMRIFLITILMMSFLYCKNRDVNLTIQTNGKLTIIDTSIVTNNFATYDAKDNYVSFPIYYIGEFDDTISLRHRRMPHYGHGEKEYFSNSFIPTPDSSKMTIFVDTMFDLTYTAYFEHFAADGSEIIQDSVHHFKSYPIFIRNVYETILYVSDCWDWKNMERQAKGKDGIWIDIEEPSRFFWCGTGCRSIIMKPGEILIAKLIRYKGDTKIECRLKFNTWKYTIYSNSFFEYIDINQLPKDVLVN